MYNYYNGLYSKLNDISISEINVGGYNAKQEDNKSKTLKEAFKENIICEFENNEDNGETISVIKTVFPHGMYESLLFVLDESKYGIDSLSNCTLKNILLFAYYFIKFVSRRSVVDRYGLDNGSFHFVYNYDPFTHDRESGMSEKSFHLHLNYWTSTEVPTTEIPFSDLDLLTKVRTVDPITFLGESVLYDLLKGKLKNGELMDMDIVRDKNHKLPFGLKVKYSSWNMLNSDSMLDDLRYVHEIMVNYYEKLEKCFLKTIRRGLWVRGTLDDKEVILANINGLKELSSRSKNYLKEFALEINNIPKITMEYFKKNKTARLLNLSMAGLNYSLGIYSPQANTVDMPLICHNEIYLTIQVKMFSGTGGAGVPKMRSKPIVVLNRNNYQYKSEEKVQREDFQFEFADELKKNWGKGDYGITKEKIKGMGTDQF